MSGGEITLAAAERKLAPTKPEEPAPSGVDQMSANSRAEEGDTQAVLADIGKAAGAARERLLGYAKTPAADLVRIDLVRATEALEWLVGSAEGLREEILEEGVGAST